MRADEVVPLGKHDERHFAAAVRIFVVVRGEKKKKIFGSSGDGGFFFFFAKVRGRVRG